MLNKINYKLRNPILVLIWSFALYILMNTPQYLGTWVASVLSGAGFVSIISGQFENHLSVFGMGFTLLIIGAPISIIVVKFLWRRSLEWMGLKFNFQLLVKGLVLGLFIPLIIIFILYLWGAVKIIGLPSRLSFIEICAGALGYLGLMIFTGIVEEIVFRGMMAREWAMKWNWLVAAFASSIIFGLLHVPKIQNADIMSAVIIVFFGMTFSILLLTMYIRSGSLWLPIGFHAGWNFCLSAIIGTTMSGEAAGFGLFHTELEGLPIITGGAFGMETSIVSLVFYIVLTFVFFKYYVNGKISLNTLKLKDIPINLSA